MRIGNKTLLFGCHQFVLHPLFVYMAWRKIYREWPSLGETVAIIIHDWGYINKTDLDGEEGEKHPELAYNIFEKISWFCNDREWYSLDQKFTDLALLCLYHSRFYSESCNAEPSKLCWADKLGSIMMGKYLWYLLSSLTGEAKEYMNNDKYKEYFKGSAIENSSAFENGLEWFKGYSAYMLPVIDKEVGEYKKRNGLE